MVLTERAEMEFNIFQGYKLQIKQFYAVPIMHGYIECCNYAEGAKKNWDRFVNRTLPSIFGDWSEHKLHWKHLDEPPTKSMGYMTPEGFHWTGYYVAVELECHTSAKPENDFCFSHYLCTMVMDTLDINEVVRRLHKMDWVNEAVDLEVG
jgi:hypothetical protein